MFALGVVSRTLQSGVTDVRNQFLVVDVSGSLSCYSASLMYPVGPKTPEGNINTDNILFHKIISFS